MNLKPIFSLLLLMLVLVSRSDAQTTYSFNVTTDTAIESTANVLIGYVKADVAPLVADTVLVSLKSGTPTLTHIDTSTLFPILFNPGVDSVAFYIQLRDDTFPEYAENLTYVLRYNGINNSLLGADSLLAFTLLDNDLPATISFVSDSGWTWEDRDTFINGIYDPDNSPFYVGIQVNNPNPFYVRYYADKLDCYHTYGLPNINSCALAQFYFNGETCYAPPGISTYYKVGNSIDQNYTHGDFHFYCVLRNIDANTIPDSLMFFTIKTDDYYDPPTVSLDTPGISLIGDTTLLLAVPITINNNNREPLYCRVDISNVHSNLPGPDFTMSNPYFGYGNGTTYDTLWLTLLNRHLINDTINADFVIRGVTGNLSPDTLFHLTIIDTGTLIVSFKGAGFAHLKDDSIGYVEVYTNSPVTYPVSVYVSYLNGDAVAGVDYLWRDTTVVFPPYLFDTIALPVIMLKNHIHDGNKQVNLQLSNVSPSFVQYDIRQYTYTIIDNDSTATYPAGVTYLNDNQINIYPNPFSSDFNIHTSAVDYKITITSLLGAELYATQNLSGDMQINLYDLPSGSYLITISSGDNSFVKMITKI